jgi:hypothetical protein
MKAPTKVWKFDQVFEVQEFPPEEKLVFKTKIKQFHGNALYNRATQDLKCLADELMALGWTLCDREYFRCADNEPGLFYFAIVHQFASSDELTELANDCLDRLKEISELKD